MGKIESFQQLDAWREAHQLVVMVYRLTEAFPQQERFGRVAQMRRAAVSVPANIAEGFKRRGIGEKIRFYNTAEASLEELKYYSSCPKIWGTSRPKPKFWLKRKSWGGS